MDKRVCIIDYSAGNLKSISKALKVVGLEPYLVSTREMKNKKSFGCDIVVLPGVGEFGSAMKMIEEIRPQIIEHISLGKPFLGICLGIQLLFSKSEESPQRKGLGVLDGKVVKFDKKNGLPVPHMCWNRLKFIDVGKNDIRKVILRNLHKEEFFYFVHSYYPVVEEKNVCFGTTNYGVEFCSMVVKDNIVATQFHLEKSGTKGLLLLENIMNYFKKM